MARLRTSSLECEKVCETFRQTCADYHTRPLPLFILQTQKGPMEIQRMRDIFQNAQYCVLCSLAGLCCDLCGGNRVASRTWGGSNTS